MAGDIELSHETLLAMKTAWIQIGEAMDLFPQGHGA